MLARIHTPLPQPGMYFQLIQLLIHDVHSLRKTPPTEQKHFQVPLPGIVKL